MQNRGPKHTSSERAKYKRRGHQVIIQAMLGGKMAQSDKVQVDVWYTSVYELFQSEWNMTRLSQMQDILKDHVKFQPRTLFRTCRFCPAKCIEKRCIQKGKYCADIPHDLAKAQEDHVSSHQQFFTPRALIE